MRGKPLLSVLFIAFAAVFAFGSAIAIVQRPKDVDRPPPNPEQQMAAEINILRKTASDVGSTQYNQLVRDDTMRAASNGSGGSSDPLDDNPFSKILQREDEENNQRLMNNLFSVGGINPNQAAEAQKLKINLGSEPPVAEQNMSELRRRKRLFQLQQYELEAQSPILARQLNDPDFAALGDKAPGPMSGIERTLYVLKNRGGQVAVAFLATFSLTLLVIILLNLAWANRGRAFDSVVYLFGRGYRLKRKTSASFASFAEQVKQAAEK